VDHGSGTGRAVVEAFASGDADALVARLAPDVVFHSPVRDYRGCERVARVLTALVRVVSDVRLTRVLGGPEDTAAFFVAGGGADGVLRVLAADDRPATELTLMLRPLEALLAGVEQMKALLGRGGRDRPAHPTGWETSPI
jgi:hypothetical protein